jgi:adenine-specific DNA methylase
MPTTDCDVVAGYGVVVRRREIDATIAVCNGCVFYSYVTYSC